MSATDKHSAVSASTAAWLQALRFRLGPTETGEYCFSNVQLVGAPDMKHRESFLRDLMTGRSIADVLRTLTPAATASGTKLPDCMTAFELRQYFQRLANLLHLDAKTGQPLPGLTPPTAIRPGSSDP